MLKYSPYGNYAAVCHNNATLTLLAVDESRRTLKRLSSASSTGTIRSIAFAPGNKYVVMSHYNQPQPYVYTISESGVLSTAIRPPVGTPVTSDTTGNLRTEFSPDTNFLITIGRNYPHVRIWQVNKDTDIFSFVSGTPQLTTDTSLSIAGRALKVTKSGSNYYAFIGNDLSPYCFIYRINETATSTLLNINFAGINSEVTSLEIVNDANGNGKYLLVGTITAGNYLQVYDISQIASGTVSKLPNLDAASLLPGYPTSMELTLDKTELFTYHAGSPYISIFNVNANTGALTLQSPRFENSSSAAIAAPSTANYDYNISVSNNKKLVSLARQGTDFSGLLRTYAIAQSISEVIEQTETDVFPVAPATGTQALQSVNGVVRWV